MLKYPNKKSLTLLWCFIIKPFKIYCWMSIYYMKNHIWFFGVNYFNKCWFKFMSLINIQALPCFIGYAVTNTKGGSSSMTLFFVFNGTVRQINACCNTHITMLLLILDSLIAKTSNVWFVVLIRYSRSLSVLLRQLI